MSKCIIYSNASFPWCCCDGLLTDGMLPRVQQLFGSHSVIHVNDSQIK